MAPTRVLMKAVGVVSECGRWRVWAIMIPRAAI